MGTDQTAELSDAGYQFLIDLFHRHDKVRINHRLQKRLSYIGL